MAPSADWLAAWGFLGVGPPPSGEWDRLAAAYGAQDRAYHNQRHLNECFEHLAAVREELAEPAEVMLALWFHDVVYDSRRPDNEERSAAWAREVMRTAGCAATTIEAVSALILSTAHHAPPELGDGRFLIDIDLAILGAAPERFDEYEGQIRREYAWVEEAAFREGRAEVLRRFLDRPSVFATDHFRARFERRARANMTQSLQHLTASRSPH